MTSGGNTVLVKEVSTATTCFSPKLSPYRSPLTSWGNTTLVKEISAATICMCPYCPPLTFWGNSIQARETAMFSTLSMQEPSDGGFLRCCAVVPAWLCADGECGGHLEKGRWHVCQVSHGLLTAAELPSAHGHHCSLRPGCASSQEQV